MIYYRCGDCRTIHVHDLFALRCCNGSDFSNSSKCKTTDQCNEKISSFDSFYSNIPRLHIIPPSYKCTVSPANFFVPYEVDCDISQFLHIRIINICPHRNAFLCQIRGIQKTIRNISFRFIGMRYRFYPVPK